VHEKNIETLREEANRLLSVEITLLTKMMDEPGVIAKAHAGQTQTFDRSTTPKHIEVLEGEQTKLIDLEMVLAVVGTMKAGKSTAINAIVGTEVLPNRNRPMTALPTLIRHTPGQLAPLLRFENDKPVVKLMHELRNAIENRRNDETIRGLETDPDMKSLIEGLRAGGNPNQRYEGAEEIFKFLKGLNDLVRLAKELDVEFPFSDYDEIHELPVIEVEFAHLPESPLTAGRLTLLDTPGPNESGQPHLRKMLKEQLSKASAVLAILDFTQLKSDADAQIRSDLKDIASLAEGRLYTLVNKFDQKDRHGDSASDVRSFVANTLMEGTMSEEDVFPVSARWAYLANRAKHELSVHGHVQADHAWVADFGEEAFGRRWESKIGDQLAVKEGADLLWNDSMFNAPLEGVIKKAHARAATFAIDSAAAKLVDMAEKMDNLLSTRETALSKSAKELQSQINALQNDVHRVESSEATAKHRAKATLSELTKGTGKVFDKIKGDVSNALDLYFKEGKAIEKQGHEIRRKELTAETASKKSGLAGFFAAFSVSQSTWESQSHGAADFDPDSPVMKFSDRQEAQALIRKIETSVSSCFRDTEKTMKAAMNGAINSFEKEFTNSVVAEARTIVDEMKDRLKDSGFSVTLKLPNATKLALGFSGSDMLGELISEKSKTVTRQRRQSGTWGSICSFFGTSDWGWEDYKVTEEFFEIDIQKIRKAMDKSLEETFEGLDRSIAQFIETPLNEAINDFFAQFKQTVEQIRGDLLQSIRDQESSKAEQAALMRKLNAIKKNVPDVLTDSRALKEDAQMVFAPVI